MHHTVAISDIHLSQLEPTSGLWMRYRQAPFVPDKELVAMLGVLREKVRDEELELILNGDIFDFDVPWITKGKTYFPSSERNAAISVPVMRDILHDHPAFIAALGQLLSDGHTLIFVSGNHDVEMTLPKIRTLVREALLDAAHASGSTEPRDVISRRIIFRAWFHLTRNGILFEHGHQYDETNCYRTIMQPYDRAGKNIAPTLGSLSARYFGARLGYFNPNVDESFMLSFWGFVKHWLKYYLFSSRSIIKTFALGSTKTVVYLVKNRGKVSPERAQHNREAAIAETGEIPASIDTHLGLAAVPVEEHLPKLLNELALDRIGIGLFAVIAAAVWIHFTYSWQMALASLPILLFLAYAILAPRRTSLDALWRQVQQATRKVADIYGANAVVFGHTHHPHGAWKNGVFFGNTGSWSAAFKDVECTIPLTEERPLIWLTKKDDASPLQGGLVAWKDGKISDAT